MRLDLILRGIIDQVVRENFQRLQTYVQSTPLLNGEFTFYEVDVKQGTNAIAHGLTFVPKDIIITSIFGDQSLYFDYMQFDKTNLYITSRGGATVRFFAGSYRSSAYGKGKALSEQRFSPPATVALPIYEVDGGDASGGS